MKKNEKLIKSKQRVRDFAEVYTPQFIVKDMCDLIPESGAWDKIDSTFLEPACGNGNFLAEILKRKLELCKSEQDIIVALKSIYGIDIQADNVAESQSRLAKMAFEKFARLYPYKMIQNEFAADVITVLSRNIICGDSLKIMEEMVS